MVPDHNRQNLFCADGRLKSSAFTGKAISRHVGNREWAHELSGRLLSLAGDVEVEAKEFCTNVQKEFAGVMYSAVAALRFTLDKITTDVRYTPLNRDRAHSDFVTFKSIDEDLPAIRDKLQEIVKPLKAGQLATSFPKKAAPTEKSA